MCETYLLANWKLWGSTAQIPPLLESLKTAVATMTGAPMMAVFPPYPYLHLAQSLLKDSSIALGAQTVSEYASGAYTGEVAAEMLLDMACRYVLVGHSERRSLFGENDAKIAAKFWHASQQGLIPVLCVGENVQQWQQGQTFSVLQQQLAAVLASKQADKTLSPCLIAYEPVWAIGTGHSAEPEYVAQVHRFIRDTVHSLVGQGAPDIPILYGGSLKAHNLAALLALPEVDGGLVGAASLQAEEFIAMINIASQVKKS